MGRTLILMVSAAAALAWFLPGGGAGSVPVVLGSMQSDSLFETSHSCFACHNGLVTSKGEEVSIASDWRATMMANSARDPYWHAAVRREAMDHPESQAAIEDECSKCHMPMARYDAHEEGGMGGVFEHLPIGSRTDHRGLLAADGVSCALCHQVTDEGLGTEASLVGGFVINPVADGAERPIYGPFEIDESRIRLMRSATGFTQTEASHIQQSEFCATCHTLITHALGPDGEVLGELPEQVPYQEWLHSDYVETDSCQDCHMPVISEPTAITSVLGEPRDGVSRHTFRGANFLMLQVFQRYRSALGVEATPAELQLAVSETRRQLGSDAAHLSVREVSVADGRLDADVSIENRAGHKFPTAYPSRRAWLDFSVRDGGGNTLFSSGALDPTGAIRGNDNDADPSRYEPHYDRITSQDQVMIYESVLIDSAGDVTTGLLSGLEYAKDNRILPTGFDKATAEPDVAVHGRAETDPNFAGGSDSVHYSVDLGDAEGPFTVEVVLRYQPVGYRWAENLRAYQADEPRRFVSYYTAMADVSAAMIDQVSVSIE